MYRAVPKASFVQDTVYSEQKTKRVPSNVPYIIDNLWELLRPEEFPSRRFSAYASPTPELALDNASAVGNIKDDYMVCEVIFSGSVKLAHLSVIDARHHADISILMRHVIKRLGVDFSNMSLADKITHAALFMPAVSKKELFSYFEESAEKKRFLWEIKGLSSFWFDAKREAQPHNGELLFEVSNGLTYQLKPI